MGNLISIIIPTYNRASVLAETLNSVLAQTHTKWEGIIVDDGSTDETEDLLEEYVRKDRRFFYIKRPKEVKKGASACRNIGLQFAKGEYIQFLDSDDIISPTKLTSQLALLSEEPDGIIACCSWSLFSDELKKDAVKIELPIKEELYKGCSFLEKLGKGNNFFPPHCYLVPRKLIELAGPWNEELTNNDDGEYFTRIILSSSGVLFDNTFDAFYRRSGTDNLSSYSNRSKILSVIKSWQIIEDSLKRSCGHESLTYVVNAKQQLFQTIKNKFPRTVAEHRDFFKVQFHEEPYRLNAYFIIRKSFGNQLRKVKRKLF